MPTASLQKRKSARRAPCSTVVTGPAIELTADAVPRPSGVNLQHCGDRLHERRRRKAWLPRTHIDCYASEKKFGYECQVGEPRKCQCLATVAFNRRKCVGISGGCDAHEPSSRFDGPQRAAGWALAITAMNILEASLLLVPSPSRSAEARPELGFSSQPIRSRRCYRTTSIFTLATPRPTIPSRSAAE